ncbi:MAG TPA: SpaA isopeptide-forming pilin-related protein, partial [Feifaniaceae bacterium]|nr:SpaA isopeptide-forming pilin-related protein [Feifaniaceae bacterium]
VLETTDQKAMGEIGFNKTSTVGRPLDGGEFELTGTDYAGNPVLKTASAVNGAVTFTGVPLGEGYVIRETVPPSGYYRTDTELVAYVRYNGGRTGAVTGVTPDTLTNEPTPSAPSGKYGSISLRKTDAAGAPLSGAEFVLIDSAGSIIQRAVSQDSGLVLFTDVPLGAYTIRESKAPAGYAPSAAAITAAVKTAGSSVHASPYTVVNNRTEGAAIHITKISSVTGEVLAGAEFTLYDAAGKAVRKAVTDIGGAALFADLAPGVYTVKETDAPDGYIAAGKTLSVTAQSRALYPFTVENDPALLNPPKTDGISGILGSLALGAALLGAAAVLAGKRRRGRGAANR